MSPTARKISSSSLSKLDVSPMIIPESNPDAGLINNSFNVIRNFFLIDAKNCHAL